MNNKSRDAIYDIISDHLASLYGSDNAAGIRKKIQLLIESHPIEVHDKSPWSQSDALCITYADSMLGSESPIETLRTFFTEHIGEVISLVHFLPFFPYTSDDGFSISDFRTVRADLGDWDDVKRFSKDRRVAFDLVLNHVSASSRYMKEYMTGNPDYADFFIEMDPNTNTSSVVRPRTLPLLHEYETSAGKKWLWTTFSRDQVDLNYENPKVLLEMIDVMLFYVRCGASMLRLDALPFVWKILGTSCSHLPQVHTLVKLLRCVLEIAAPHVRILSETNVPHHENITYFGDHDEAHMIYNFTLAPLILWVLMKGDSSALSNWARDIEKISDDETFLNITATHDGIGVRPTEGILSDDERKELVQHTCDRGGRIGMKTSADGKEVPYELNINYFDAVNNGDVEPLELRVKRFLLSQSIPIAMMGVPAIYIHSLLGSVNDYEGLNRTGANRSINREHLHLDAIASELKDPKSRRAMVLSGIKHLLSERSNHTALSPLANQDIPDMGTGVFAIHRYNTKTGDELLALHNVTNSHLKVPVSSVLNTQCRDVLADELLNDSVVDMLPYQVRWLKSEHDSAGKRKKDSESLTVAR